MSREATLTENPVTENENMDGQQPESVEPVVYNPLTPSERKKFESEPILQQRSNVCGWVELFAPNAPASEWASRPWLLKCEKDGAGRPYADHESAAFKIEVNGPSAHEAFQRPYFAEKTLHWHYVELGEMPELVTAGAPEIAEQSDEDDNGGFIRRLRKNS